MLFFSSTQTPAGLEEKDWGGRLDRWWGRLAGSLGALAAVEASGLGRGGGAPARGGKMAVVAGEFCRRWWGSGQREEEREGGNVRKEITVRHAECTHDRVLATSN